MTKIKNIIFDFDGALVDTAPVIIRTMQAAIKELGLPEKTEEESRATIGLRLDGRNKDRNYLPFDKKAGNPCFLSLNCGLNIFNCIRQWSEYIVPRLVRFRVRCGIAYWQKTYRNNVRG